MEWSTVVFLGMGMLSILTLIGLIIVGTKESSDASEFGEKTKNLSSDLNELRKVLKRSDEEKEQLKNRLQNLETIVTSEVWESIKSGEPAQHIQLDLNEEEAEELNNSEKAAKIAKRVR